MKQKIIQVGNSAAVIIPKNLLSKAGLEVGSRVVLEKDPNGKTLVLSKNGSKFKSSITPDFEAIVERVNKQYGQAFKELAQGKA